MQGARRRVSALTLALLGGAAWCGGAAAQTGAVTGKPGDGASTELGEIVVTAQRRTESLMSVPLAVSALSGDTLLKQGIARPGALASLIPNLQVNDSTGGAEPNFTLRAVGLGNDYSSNQASPVGVYVDDAYLAFRATHGAQMFDLERVEVLRGPQGTLFGRNTTGGAVNFITRKPQLGAPNGYVDVGYGNFNDVRVEAAAEATPVANVLGVRAAVSFERHDGYIDNKFPGAPDLASGNDLRTRLSIRFTPSETVEADLRLFANRARQYQPAVIAVGLGPGGANPIDGYTHAGLGFFETSSDDPHRNKTSSQGGALTLKVKLADGLSVQSLTSYDTAKSLFGQDVDGSPVNLLETIFGPDHYREFNQEVRLVYDRGPLKAQGGVFYGRDRVAVHNQYTLLKFLQGFGVPADPFFAKGGGTIDQRYRQVRISKAIFGQADLQLSPELTVTVGARYTKDEARYENGSAVIGDYDFHPIVQVVGAPGAPLNRQGENKALTGRVAVSYQFTAGPLVYASYNRGYRAGTFNGSGYLDPSQITFVAPERVNAYEAGAKGRFLDGALSLAAAAFWYDYTNQQIQDQIGPVAFLRSAGSSTIKGAELEATWRLTPTVSFTGSAGYTHSRYDRLTLQNVVLDGDKLPLAPAVTAHLQMDYTIPDLVGGDLTLTPSVTYTSSFWFTPYNAHLDYAPLRQGGYALVDGVAEWKRGPWAVRVWAKNLTNTHYYTYGVNLDSFGFYYFNPNTPRTFGAAVRRTF